MPRTKKATSKIAAKENVAALNVAQLRRDIAKFVGVQEAPKSVIARLVGASHGSVVNWERGLPPSPRYLPKLREVERQLKAGTLRVELPKRGPKPRTTKASTTKPKSRTATATSHAAAAKPKSPAKRVAIIGNLPVSYANTINIAKGAREARLTFGFALSGESGARGVADLVVPVQLLEEAFS